jgi:two-component system chemotaxis response regulator CheY
VKDAAPAVGGRADERQLPMGKRILIVDDSSIMRKMIKQVLASGGHEVVGEAKNGVEAVDLYRALAPDLVTMDITMREMDGFAAARNIMADDPSASIVFLSNLDREKYEKDVLSIGAKGFVRKNEHERILQLIRTL